jgi:hypothetical protein
LLDAVVIFSFEELPVIAIAIEVFGWMGGLMLILAYALVSFKKIAGHGAVFQILNLAGSILLAANAAWHRALPSAAVNLIWIGVGIVALLRGWLVKAQ